MKEMIILSLKLGLICAISAIALTQISNLTREPIRLAEEKAQREAIDAVLPEFTELSADTVDVNIYFVGKQNDILTGAAFSSTTNLGYSGEIEIMVGVDAFGVVNGVRILRHAETPGLGSKYADPEVLRQFYVGANLAGRDWRCKKDGGDIDAVTGATVTGRAILDALTTGLEKFEQDRESLISAEEK